MTDAEKWSSSPDLHRNDLMIVAYARWIVRQRWLVLSACLLAAIALGLGVRQLGFSTDYRIFFSEQNPQLQAYESLQQVYTKDDNILIVLQPADGDVFTPGTLRAVQQLTAEAWQLPFSRRVDSLTNFQHSYARGDDLTVEDLVPTGADMTPERMEEVRQVALSEPLLVDRLVAPDGRTTAVNVTLTLPGESAEEPLEAMAAVRDLVAGLEADYPDITFAVTGVVALNAAFSEASFADLSTLIPLMYGIIVVGLLLFLRSIAGTLVTLLVVGLSAASGMGLAGWLGIELSPPSAVAPTIILTLAVADSIHLLVTMLHAMGQGADKRSAIIESLRVNFGPVFLTSLTTAIGFLSLNFSDAPPFRDLGNITAMGVVAAWLYSVTFLPAFLAVVPMRVPRLKDGNGSMERLATFVLRRRRGLLWGMTALVLVLAIWIPRIELNDQFVNYFEPSIPFRADTDFAMEHLSGIYQMEFSLPAAQTGGISEPDYLRAVDGFTRWLRARPEVVNVQSLTDIYMRLNKNMHGDDPAWYRLPEARDLAAQYLLLFEMSLPYGLDLNNQINVDKSSLRVIATLENITTRQARTLRQDAGAWLDANMPTAAGTEPTGPYVMFAYISERNIEAMLIGTALALVLISLSLIVALRSLKIGFLSIVPNVVPAVMAFGLWGLLVGEIGLASSVVAATSLGIIVDDCVHFLSKYLRARREKDASPDEAVRYAFATVGRALWITSAVLIAGFATLVFSAFELNQSLGLLTALAIFAALIADFLLLPPLLLAIEKETKHADSSDALVQPVE